MATERGARGAAATGTVFRWSLLGYIVVEYAGLLGTWPWRETLASVLGGVVLVAALVLLPPRARLLPLGLVAAGLAVTATARAPAGVLLACLREMSNVAALLALLPVLGRVFQVKPYGLALFGTGRPLSRSPVAFQQAVSLLAHAVGAVATFSALVVTYEVLRQAASDQRRLVRGCVAILRGYTASILWSPNATAFAIAAHYTGAPLARAVPGGLCLAAAAFVYQTVFEWWEERRLRVVGATAAVDGVAAAAAEGGVPPVRRRLVAEFLVIMAGLLGSVVVLEEAVGIDIVHLVPLVGVAAAVALSFFLDGGLAAVGRLAGEYGRDGLLARHREMALVQSAGFLVGSLRLSGLGGAGLDFLRRSLPDTPLGLAPWLAVLILVLGFVGFPPIPATLMVVASVDPATFGDAPAYFALSLVVGTSVSLLLAPFSIPVVVLSAATGREAREFGFRANWLYGAGLLVVGQAVLWLLHSRTGIV